MTPVNGWVRIQRDGEGLDADAAAGDGERRRPRR